MLLPFPVLPVSPVVNRFSRQSGLSRLEFAVAAAIVGIFAALLLGRLLHYEAVAERVRFDLAVREMQHAQRMRVAALMVAQQPVDYARMAAENPVAWLDKQPAGYVGEVERPDAAKPGKGEWAFDRRQRKLLYRPRFPREFDNLAGREGVVRVGLYLRYTRDGRLPTALDVRAEQASSFTEGSR